MKQLWLYLIASFPDDGKLIKKIKKAATEQQYHQAVDQLMAAASPAAADPLRTTPASLV